MSEPTNKSVRFHVQLLPVDVDALSTLLALLPRCTKSAVARDALVLLDQLIAYRARGYRIVLRHAALGEQYGLAIAAGGDCGDIEAKSIGSRGLSPEGAAATSLQVRLPLNDVERLERLMTTVRATSRAALV